MKHKVLVGSAAEELRKQEKKGNGRTVNFLCFSNSIGTRRYLEIHKDVL